jgi:DNA polymerase III delta subunit
MVYLFVGIDENSKERKFQQLKKEIFKDKQESFNYERLYAEELTPTLLKDTFRHLPVSSEKRLVFIRDIDRLDEKCREIILSYLKRPNKRFVLVLDTQVTQLKDNFLRRVANQSKTFSFGSKRRLDTFVLAEAIKRGRSSEALKIFESLYKKGEQPARILGGLVWAWKDTKRFLKKEVFSKGIELFLETDVNIKFSRLKPKVAMEMLIVKLCFLTGG